MAYVIQLSNMQVFLFETKDEAIAFESRKGAKTGIVAGAFVDGAKHYRGRIPAIGVRFTKQDQSHAQLLGALHRALDTGDEDQRG